MSKDRAGETGVHFHAVPLPRRFRRKATVLEMHLAHLVVGLCHGGRFFRSCATPFARWPRFTALYPVTLFQFRGFRGVVTVKRVPPHDHLGIRADRLPDDRLLGVVGHCRRRRAQHLSPECRTNPRQDGHNTVNRPLSQFHAQGAIVCRNWPFMAAPSRSNTACSLRRPTIPPTERPSTKYWMRESSGDRSRLRHPRCDLSAQRYEVPSPIHRGLPKALGQFSGGVGSADWAGGNLSSRIGPQLGIRQDERPFSSCPAVSRFRWYPTAGGTVVPVLGCYFGKSVAGSVFSANSPFGR